MRKILIGSAVVALVSWASAAAADTLYFSFTGPVTTTGNAPSVPSQGTVTGELYGVSPNGSSTPTGIKITSSPGGFTGSATAKTGGATATNGQISTFYYNFSNSVDDFFISYYPTTGYLNAHFYVTDPNSSYTVHTFEFQSGPAVASFAPFATASFTPPAVVATPGPVAGAGLLSLIGLAVAFSSARNQRRS